MVKRAFRIFNDLEKIVFVAFKFLKKSLLPQKKPVLQIFLKIFRCLALHPAPHKGIVISTESA
jgi:hypothetical protein